MPKVIPKKLKNLAVTGVPFVVLFLALAGVVYAASWSYSNISVGENAFRSNHTGTIHTRRADSTRFRITNNSGNDLFIPNKNSSEFNSFRNNTPSGVSICQPTDGGWGNWYTVSKRYVGCSYPGDLTGTCRGWGSIYD